MVAAEPRWPGTNDEAEVPDVFSLPGDGRTGMWANCSPESFTITSHGCTATDRTD